MLLEVLSFSDQLESSESAGFRDFWELWKRWAKKLPNFFGLAVLFKVTEVAVETFDASVKLEWLFFDNCFTLSNGETNELI